MALRGAEHSFRVAPWPLARIRMTEKQITIITQLRSALHRYQFVILTMLIGGFGAALIVYQGKFQASDGARDFGIALFAAGTIGLAVEFYTRRQFRDLVKEDLRGAVDTSSLSAKLDDMLTLISLGGDLRELGVRRIHRNRNAIDFSHLIEEAEAGTELRLLGVCLAGFMDRQSQVLIEKKLREGCRARFLILDPASDAVGIRAIEENRTYEDIRKDIGGADEIHDNFIGNRVAKDLRGQIELGHYSAAPAYFIFSTHNTMIVGFYLRGDLGEFFPQLELEIKEGGIYAPFSHHLEGAPRSVRRSCR
jgi:hypothetical protein